MLFHFTILLLISKINSKTYEYGITGRSKTPIRSTSYHVDPLNEKTEKLQHLLENLTKKPKLRRLHGAKSAIPGKPIVISSNSLITNKKSSFPRAVATASASVNVFEQELAKQIEEDQLKFVEDEKNPLKYVVHEGLLYKQSRYSPLARLEMPQPPKVNKHKPKKRKKSKKTAVTNTLRTNVFRGNINRQIPAIPIPPDFFSNPTNVAENDILAGNSISSSSDRIVENDEKCQINRFGFLCCDPMLESLMLKSFIKLRRKDDNANLTQIARTLRSDARNFFHKEFETIVSFSDFGTSIPTSFHCKVGLGFNNMVAMAFIPNDENEAVGIRKKRRDLPYHELSREDLQESADLVVSRNGILVSREVLDITSE